MREFTRFEYQYILMLAGRARQDMMEDKKNGVDQIDPNIDSYINALESIANKAHAGMKEIDKRKEAK